jgi:Zn-dependent protease
MLFLFTRSGYQLFLDVAATNFFLIYLNILPIPPLDGYNFFVNILPRAISRYITGIVRGRETAFLGILFLIFATPAGGVIFTPAFYLFEGLAQSFFAITGFRG